MSTFSGLIQSICSSKNIGFNDFDGSDILELNYGNNIRKRIFGYAFDLNPSTLPIICQNKATLSEILEARNVPRVKHFIFHRLESPFEERTFGNYKYMFSLLDEYKNLIVKPVTSMNGRFISLVKNDFELECSVETVLRNSEGVVVCPYDKILDEIRVVILNDRVVLAYSKSQAPNNPLSHNASQGSMATLLTEYNNDNTKYTEIAKAAARALHMSFGCIDLILVPSADGDTKYKVLDATCSVALESFARQCKEYKKIAIGVYSAAIDAMGSE